MQMVLRFQKLIESAANGKTNGLEDIQTRGHKSLATFSSSFPSPSTSHPIAPVVFYFVLPRYSIFLRFTTFIYELSVKFIYYYYFYVLFNSFFSSLTSLVLQ